MYHDFNYEATLASSLRAQWQLDDVLRADQELDFSRNMMPESLARTAAVQSLNPFEQRVLNQISAHQYLSIFGVVEEFILPFLLDHARPALRGDDWRVRAVLQPLARAEIGPVSSLAPVANESQAGCNLHEPRIGANRCEIRPEQCVALDEWLESRVFEQLIHFFHAPEIPEGEQNPVLSCRGNRRLPS
jgi:hypothetical protein